MEGLGSRIKLVHGNLSQEDFASLIGVDKSTLASYEIDRREPALENLVKIADIADIADVSLDWLAGRQDTPSIEQAQAYNAPKWYEVKDLAFCNNVKPIKIKQLMKAALALK